MKRALILGGAGFIGTALTRRLVDENYWVHVVDIRRPPVLPSLAHAVTQADLRCEFPQVGPVDEVYQLACDLGGAGHIYTGRHDADMMASNVSINANVCRTFAKLPSWPGRRLLFMSSICAVHPSTAYGLEKLFSEKLYRAHAENHGLSVCIMRPTTVYGPGCVFDGGREQAVAAICRKVIDAPDGGDVQVWGDGSQQRSLVYIDDLIDAVTMAMRSRPTPCFGPMNFANTDLTACNEIARKAIALSGKKLAIKNVDGPVGEQVLDVDNGNAELILGWRPTTPFDVGLERTFNWIAAQKSARAAA